MYKIRVDLGVDVVPVSVQNTSHYSDSDLCDHIDWDITEFQRISLLNLFCGRTSCNVLSQFRSCVLSIDSPKNVQITILPSGEIEEGHSLTLRCMSNANPALTNYTWFKMSDANVSYIGYDSKYILGTVGQKDAGRYFCVAMNDMGSQNSTVIELKVKGT